MNYIGVDIGGTFTDCVLIDEQGKYRTAKSLSTKSNPSEAVLAGLDLLARAEGLRTEELLATTARFGHGTTIATNAVLERSGARVGLVATAGHGDALAMMRGSGRVAGKRPEEVFSAHGTRLPDPIIVRGAVLEVQERIDFRGSIVVPLDTGKTTAEVLEFIRRYELDSIAISFLWSFANPVHEQQLAETIHRAAPDLFISLSSQVSPRLGEYERTVATIINGYVGPASSRYLHTLADHLKQRALGVPMLVMQSNGGVLPAEAAAATSLGTIDSGPAGGLIGVSTLASRRGHNRVIATDMGGTSFDIGLIIDGNPMIADENVIDSYTYRLPHLDVRTTACGGGSLAYIDKATGALRVGPQSAGSEPGPVCYKRGGTIPTVTDADVVLGFLRPDAFLDGRMVLDREAAVAAIAKLADKLDLSVEETAAGIVEINNLRAATMIRQQTVEHGYDPREFVLYAYGGAGPVHASSFAKESGIKEIVIPLGNGASTLSAYGIASGNVTIYRELERQVLAPFTGDQAERLTSILAQIERSARAKLDELDTSGHDDSNVEITALMRYGGQLMHSLEIPIGLPAGKHTGQALLSSFHAEYHRRYRQGGTTPFQQPVEIFAFRARAFRSTPVPEPALSAPAKAERTTAEVYWPGHGWTATPVYGGTPTDPVTGPALVELAHTTIVVTPGARLSRTDAGDLSLRLPLLEKHP